MLKSVHSLVFKWGTEKQGKKLYKGIQNSVRQGEFKQIESLLRKEDSYFTSQDLFKIKKRSP